MLCYPLVSSLFKKENHRLGFQEVDRIEVILRIHRDVWGQMGIGNMGRGTLCKVCGCLLCRTPGTNPKWH